MTKLKVEYVYNAAYRLAVLEGGETLKNNTTEETQELKELREDVKNGKLTPLF